MVSLKQIAQQAGVSISAVSMALRNHPRISRARRAEIQRIARKLGYRKSIYVSSLMRHIRHARPIKEKETLAVVWVSPVEDIKQESPLKRMCDGARIRAKELGYRLDLFRYNDPEISPERLNRILISRGIRGVLIVPYGVTHAEVRMDWDHFSVATINYSMPNPPIHRAVAGFFSDTVIVLRKLWNMGYRRIGLISRKERHQFIDSLIMGAYLDFMHEHYEEKMERIPPPVFYNSSPDWPRDFFAWYQRVKPDAILTMRWEIAAILRKQGIRIPGDVGMAILNHSNRSVDFAGVDPLSERIGAVGVDLVTDQLENNEFGIPSFPKVITIEGQWINGPSVLEKESA